MVALGEGAVSYERGTPVPTRPLPREVVSKVVRGRRPCEMHLLGSPSIVYFAKRPSKGFPVQILVTEVSAPVKGTASPTIAPIPPTFRANLEFWSFNFQQKRVGRDQGVAELVGEIVDVAVLRARLPQLQRERVLY